MLFASLWEFEIMYSEILRPVVALAVWTMIMWIWLYATRIPAMSKAKIDLANWFGGTGKDLDGKLPDKVQWVAHNFNHLHEAPTVFYAIALVLAMVGQGDGMNATIAWVYVGLRIVHSLVQALWNKITVRFTVYALSSLALMALVLHAGIYVFSDHTPDCSVEAGHPC
jgi:hypothetical protein